ncbi:hypothetical protein VP1G_04069 [Cytospora mali]|uniref:NAD(P)-binding domain-containing protein n=1 Tax=Cytospora mali TaxID=578113 RepID=A0A194UYP4_CYTMA|nr:hypothetical protein VP1G_04069 [Valsa mali var. pyri (nom. inval.)]
MPRIFCIGGTGHVGGAILHKLLEQYPSDDLQVNVLVRSEDKASRLVSRYPRVQTVIGDLGDYDKIETASRDADIVISTAPDITHDAGIRAIIRGLKARAASGSPRPYYIQTSGASLIWDEPEGSKDARWWDDIADVAELSSKEDKHTHAVTDRIVRSAAPDIHVALVSPGFIGGLSPSLEHPTPISMPALVGTARAFGSGFQIAEGENALGWIHVLDLARIFMLLVDDAVATLAGRPIQRPADQLPVWGPEAYYFGTGEVLSFADFMKGLAPVLHEHGVISSTEIKSVNVTEAARISLAGPGGEYDADAPPPPPDSWAMHIAIMYGVNMRIRSSRIERLGWKPEMGSIVDALPEVVPAFLRREDKSA